jgi:hypothetical protein
MLDKDNHVTCSETQFKDTLLQYSLFHKPCSYAKDSGTKPYDSVFDTTSALVLRIRTTAYLHKGNGIVTKYNFVYFIELFCAFSDYYRNLIHTN